MGRWSTLGGPGTGGTGIRGACVLCQAEDTARKGLENTARLEYPSDSRGQCSLRQDHRRPRRGESTRGLHRACAILGQMGVEGEPLPLGDG